MYEDAMLEIRQLWNAGATEFTLHAQDAMEARGVDANDIQHVVRFGNIVDHETAEESPSGLRRYTLRGRSVDGDKLDCVIDVDEGLIIVTVITKR